MDDLFKDEKKIKHVAMYARKSRGDGVEDLEKHISTMRATCEAYNWTYELFTEIKSGNTIIDRPVMSELLNKLENTTEFDALLAFDQDRLSRGGSTDQQQIMYILKKSNTMLILCNPYQFLDPNNESHEELMNIRSFTAQMELRQTRKRFAAGKRIGATMGNWVYGTSPYGYKYDRKTKRLILDEHESSIVTRIKNEFLEDKPISDITWNLNQDHIPSRSGGMWNKSVVRAILKNEVYTGCTIFNKSQGTPENRSKNRYSISNPYKPNPKSEWKYIYNTHPALISEEEHKLIVSQIESRGHKRKSEKRNIYALSGLVKTPDGDTYSVRQSKRINSLTTFNKKYKDTPCYIVEDAIMTTLEVMKDRLEEQLEKKDTGEVKKSLEKQLADINNQILKATHAIDRAKEGFLEGIFESEEMKKIQYDKGIEISQLEDEANKLRVKLNSISNADNLERINRIDDLLNKLTHNEFTEEQKNDLYKSIVSSIILKREIDYELDVIVNFL